MLKYKTKSRTYHVAESSAQSDEAAGDGSVVVVDPEDQRHGQDLVWGGMHVRWGEGQNLPSVQAGAYLGVRWLVVEAHEEEEVHLAEVDHAAQVEDGKGLVVDVCKVRVVADGCGVQEGGVGHGVRGQVEVLGSRGQVSP